MKKAMGLLIVLVISLSAQAQQQELNNLAWLQGCWVGKGLGGEIQECWLQDNTGQLTGVFQLSENQRQSFSEMMSISKINNRVAMRVKHFSPNFRQWASDKNHYQNFDLVKQEKHAIHFKGLSYQLIEKDTLMITLYTKNTNGKISENLYFMARRKF